VLAGLEVWRNDGGLGQSDEKEYRQKGTNIKENKAVTKSGATGAAQRSEAVRNDLSAASAAWTNGEMIRQATAFAVSC